MSGLKERKKKEVAAMRTFALANEAVFHFFARFQPISNSAPPLL